jgi:hypothetical protein
MPDLLHLPNELLLDIAALLRLRDLNRLAQGNHFFHSLLNKRVHALAAPHHLQRVIDTSALPSFLRFISYGLINASTTISGIPIFAYCANRPLLLPHLAPVVDAREWCFVVRHLDDNFMTKKAMADALSWQRGVQAQNAGFREKAAVVRRMGACERQRAEFTSMQEWFAVEWGWLKWEWKDGRDGMSQSVAMARTAAMRSRLPVSVRVNDVAFKATGKPKGEQRVNGYAWRGKKPRWRY